MANSWGNSVNSDRLLLGGSKITTDGECSHEIKRHLLLGIKVITNPNSILKSRDITLPTKVCLVKAMVFLVVMYRCETIKTIKKAECWKIDAFELVLEKTLESPLDCKKIQPAHPKGNQSWIFTGRTDAEAGTLILWPPDVKNWLIGKDPDASKDWRWEKKGTTNDEMAEWHHQLNGRVWVDSRSWWWTGRPGMLQLMGSQRIRHDGATELNTNTNLVYSLFYSDQES